MELEHTVKVLTIDDKLQSEVAALNRQGWQLVPGVQPVAVYHLVRVKNQVPTAVGMGSMTIDDSGVTIIPARKN